MPHFLLALLTADGENRRTSADPG